MKLLFLALAAMLFVTGIASAQSNFKPGYILNTKGDTVKGFIDYREWERNPRQVMFKPSNAQSAQKITPANSNGFGINGSEFYDKAKVKVSTSQVELSQLSERLDTAYTTDTVFLRQVVKGSKISLYVFTDAIKPHFYILDHQAGAITALEQYLYLDGEARGVVTVNTFTRQLMGFTVTYQPGNSNLQYSISRLKYDEDDLAGVVIKINNDKEGKKAILKNSITRGFFGVAVRRQSFGIKSGIGISPFPDGTNSNTISGSVSVGMDFVANKHTEKMVVRLEAMAAYSPLKLEDPVNGQSVRHRLDIKQTTIAFVPQVIYNFYSAEKLKAFIDIGAGLNFYAHKRYGYEYLYKDGTKDIAIDYPALENFMINFPIKAGVQLKKDLQIYVGYTTKNAIARYPYWLANISSTQFGVNYLFR